MYPFFLIPIYLFFHSFSCTSLAGEIPVGAATTLVHGDSRIGTYISSKKGFETSSYWIEGPSGLIFIDTQFLLSAAEESLNWAEKVTGKKVVLAFVLHPNPDKFNGTGIFKKRGIKVLSSDQVISLIPSVHKDRHHWFYERYQPDYPNTVTLPESFGSTTKEISAGGVTVKAHVLGAGCSAAHVVIEFENHAFVGDLITNHNHSWIELGELEHWLERLDEIEALEPEFIHPGRGPVGGAGLIESEQAYLKRVLKLVRAAGPKLPMNKITEKKLEAIQEKILDAYPGYGYEHFVEIGLAEVWKRQAGKKTKSLGDSLKF